MIHYDFDKPNKESWLKKIAPHLRDKLNFDFSKTIEYNPFVSKSDSELVALPFKKSNNWFISEKIEGVTNEILNKNILLALEGGANAISLKITKNWEILDFQEIFKGVFINYIFIDFQLEIALEEIQHFIKNFKEFIQLSELNSAKIQGSFSSNNTIENETIYNDFKLIKSYQFSPSKSLNPINQLAEILIDAENKIHNCKIQNIDSNIANKFIFELELDNQFYLNIAKIRCLNILWATILEQYGIAFEIFVKCKLNNHSQPDQNLAIVAYSNQVISAIIGGAQLIEIESISNESNVFGQEFLTRILRNIQNIANIEAKLSFLHDPAKGSYFIDNLTKEITEKVWELFLANHKLNS
jgi:methylmalonyl-CoA mutase